MLLRWSFHCRPPCPCPCPRLLHRGDREGRGRFVGRQQIIPRFKFTMVDSPVLTLSSVIMTLRHSSDPKCILCGKCARLVSWEGQFLVTSYVTSKVGQKGRGRRGRGRNAMTTRVVRRIWETFRSSNTEISLYVCSLVMMGIATRRSQTNWREASLQFVSLGRKGKYLRIYERRKTS